MKYEMKSLYNNGVGTRAMKDRELSVPITDISEEDAKKYMELILAMGGRKHETETQIFFDQIIDSNHSNEYVFYK